MKFNAGLKTWTTEAVKSQGPKFQSSNICSQKAMDVPAALLQPTANEECRGSNLKSLLEISLQLFRSEALLTFWACLSILTDSVILSHTNTAKTPVCYRCISVISPLLALSQIPMLLFYKHTFKTLCRFAWISYWWAPGSNLFLLPSTVITSVCHTPGFFKEVGFGEQTQVLGLARL